MPKKHRMPKKHGKPKKRQAADGHGALPQPAREQDGDVDVLMERLPMVEPFHQVQDECLNTDGSQNGGAEHSSACSQLMAQPAPVLPSVTESNRRALLQEGQQLSATGRRALSSRQDGIAEDGVEERKGRTGQEVSEEVAAEDRRRPILMNSSSIQSEFHQVQVTVQEELHGLDGFVRSSRLLTSGRPASASTFATDALDAEVQKAEAKVSDCQLTPASTQPRPTSRRCSA